MECFYLLFTFLRHIFCSLSQNWLHFCYIPFTVLWNFVVSKYRRNNKKLKCCHRNYVIVRFAEEGRHYTQRYTHESISARTGDSIYKIGYTETCSPVLGRLTSVIRASQLGIFGWLDCGCKYWKKKTLSIHGFKTNLSQQRKAKWKMRCRHRAE